MAYNDKLDPEDQVYAEEAIAATIFDFVRNREEPMRGDGGIDEEIAAQLGRDILHLVLTRFRPDLMEK